MDFKDRFKGLRAEKNISQKEMGNILGLSQETISLYESGRRQPDFNILKNIAGHFNVSTDYLLGRSNFKEELPKGAYIPESTKMLPILGVVRAGEPLFAQQNIIGYFSIDSKLIPSGDYFYLKVVGDSMNLSHILDGQLILIRKQEEVENGEMALVLVDGENATIKKFYKNDNMVTLMPHSSNTEHQPRVIDVKITSVQVIGKVAGTFIGF